LRTALRDELDTEPDATTRELHTQIRGGKVRTDVYEAYPTAACLSA
jgi:hypothetical protein